MTLNLIERLQAKLELFRLEQRYTRRRSRRSTFVSNAVYVDGEYVYQTPNATGSSTGSGSSNNTSSGAVDALHFDEPAGSAGAPTPKNKKRLSRFASMPGFGSGSKGQAADWRDERGR